MEVKVFDCEYKGDCDNKIVVHKRHYGINVINKWEVLYPIESEYERRNSVTFPTKEHAILFANALAGNNNDMEIKVRCENCLGRIKTFMRSEYEGEIIVSCDNKCENCGIKNNNFKVGDEVYYFRIERDIPRILKGVAKSYKVSKTYKRIEVEHNEYFDFESVFRTEEEARASIKLVEGN